MVLVSASAWRHGQSWPVKVMAGHDLPWLGKAGNGQAALFHIAALFHNADKLDEEIGGKWKPNLPW